MASWSSLLMRRATKWVLLVKAGLVAAESRRTSEWVRANTGQAVDTVTLTAYTLGKTEAAVGRSILHEVPLEEADEERQGDHYEEWQAGNSGGVCHLRHQDVQDRQGVEPQPTGTHRKGQDPATLAFLDSVWPVTFRPSRQFHLQESEEMRLLPSARRLTVPLPQTGSRRQQPPGANDRHEMPMGRIQSVESAGLVPLSANVTQSPRAV
jgi:hypothetical protein